MIDAYLNRLGVPRPRTPSPAALAAVHRAHVARVPYENVLIQLGRPAPLDPAVTIARILRGGGGYCFELNGALATLLTALGYEVTRHCGRVWRGAPDPHAPVSHLVLTVRCADGSEWFVETGMSEAVGEPIPLTPGEVRQGPFRYRLDRPDPGTWRFHNDPDGNFTGMDFPAEPAIDSPAEPATGDVFERAHRRMSTDPDSTFVRVLRVARHDTTRAEGLRGLVLTRWDASGRVERCIDDRAEWFALLHDRFGVPALDAGDRDALWDRVCAAHIEWALTG